MFCSEEEEEEEEVGKGLGIYTHLTVEDSMHRVIDWRTGVC